MPSYKPKSIGGKIRALVWAAPVLAAWHAGCRLKSSCEDFESDRIETRVPVPSGVIGSADDPLASDEACQTFCQQHVSSSGTPFACRAAADDGGIVIVCSFNTVCAGRRPEGFRAPECDVGAPLLGRYFAAMAAGEAASSDAFERLADELVALDMPAGLVARARRAAREEMRHFRLTAALARRFGAAAKRAHVPARRRRTLLDLAVDNAREGVVRETFGAVAGWWQAQHATERVVRDVMRRIAHDETSHAELSWALDVAARERLTVKERHALDAATAVAVERLERDLDTEVLPELASRAGLPNRRVTRALFDTTKRTLWS